MRGNDSDGIASHSNGRVGSDAHRYRFSISTTQRVYEGVAYRTRAIGYFVDTLVSVLATDQLIGMATKVSDPFSERSAGAVVI